MPGLYLVVVAPVTPAVLLHSFAAYDTMQIGDLEHYKASQLGLIFGPKFQCRVCNGLGEAGPVVITKHGWPAPTAPQSLFPPWKLLEGCLQSTSVILVLLSLFLPDE